MSELPNLNGKATSLADFQPFSVAEAKIVSDLRRGDFDRLGDGGRPEHEHTTRTVRAELLRFLILGGEEGHRPHEKGVRITGAWLVGVLDLEGCRIPRDIGLKDCHFEAVPVLRSAIIDNLFLDGSSLPGLQADQLEARGSIFMRGAMISGEVSLPGARIGGNLEGDGASVDWGDGVAINAENMEARGSVLLRGAEIRGGLNLSGARFGGDVNCVGANVTRPDAVAINADSIAVRGDLAMRGATIIGEIHLQGAHFGGDIDCSGTTLSRPEGAALKLNRTNIDGAFFLRQGASIQGTLNLTATKIGAIDDEQACWPATGDLLLNRCLYGAFIGGPVDAKSRLDWLSRQVPERWGEDFWPQPYEQLATVLRAMGHEEDARAVLITKERLQRQARRLRTKNAVWRAILTATDGFLAVTVRYGRQPLVALLWLVLFWATGVIVFDIAQRHDALKPNSAIVLRSLEWTMCGLEKTESRFMPSTERVMEGRAEKGQTQLACFLSQPEAASYPEFNSPMYSLEALLPVLDVGQRTFWRPDPAKPFGLFILTYFYLQTVIGWALSLLAVAGFSGLVRSR